MIYNVEIEIEPDQNGAFALPAEGAGRADPRLTWRQYTSLSPGRGRCRRDSPVRLTPVGCGSRASQRGRRGGSGEPGDRGQDRTRRHRRNGSPLVRRGKKYKKCHGQ